MAYVLRRENLSLLSKTKFEFFSGKGFPQLANRFDHTVNIPVFKYKTDVWDWVNKLGYTKQQLENYGYELVQVKNRAVPGLMKEAQAYNSKLRALRGATAMLAAIYEQAGYSSAAHIVRGQSECVRVSLSAKYQAAKTKIEKEYEDAKSRQ